VRLKIFICVLVVLSTGLRSISQDSDSVSSYIIQTGIMVGPSYMHPLNHSELLEPAGTTSYHLRAHLVLPLSENLEARFGVGIARIPVIQKDYSITLGTDIDPTTGIDYYSSWTEVDVIMYKFLVPLDLNYYLIENSKGPYVGIGAQLNISLWANGKHELYESGINIIDLPLNNTVTFRSVILAPEFRTGYDFKLSNQLSLSAEAYVQYWTQGHILNQNMHLIEIGTRLGVRFASLIKSAPSSNQNE